MKITISFPQCGTEIPYFDQQNSNPATRHEYVDIRANPSAIDQLPEIALAPELRAFLLIVNGKHTIFRTFGCNYAYQPGELIVPTRRQREPVSSKSMDEELTEEERTTDVVDSYVHVGFADIERCQNLDDYYRLCGRLSKCLCEEFGIQYDGSDGDYFAINLAIENLRLYGEDKGRVLSIECGVQDFSEIGVKDKWTQLMNVIVAFLAKERLN